MFRCLKGVGGCLALLMVVDGVLSTAICQEISFDYQVIDSSVFGPRDIADIDGNDLSDIVAVNQEEEQVRLVWYEYPQWEKHIICNISTLHDYKDYRSCDLETADIDGDGDMDVVGRIGKKEDDVQGINCWFENPLPDADPSIKLWKRHDIGVSEYVKDIHVIDFNHDRRMDVVCRTPHQLYIWVQKRNRRGISWTRISFPVPPQEGMDIGDLDRDGDPDIVLGGCWFETPANLTKGTWKQHTIDAKWYNQETDDWRDNCTKVSVADMNGDGCLDVLFAHSEKPGYPVSWYQAPLDPQTGSWIEHIIGQIDYCHNLQTEDMDNDGDLDVLAGEMPRYEAPYPLVVFLNQGDALHWKTQLLNENGNYNAQTGDLDNDGDIDIVGLRRYDQPPIELWINRTSDHKLTLDRWTYIEVDNNRGKWGDTAPPEWLRYFGVAMRDLTQDGYMDIVSGRYFYHNPQGQMTAPWSRIDFGLNADAILTLDIDGDAFGDVIAQALPTLYWLEAQDAACTTWNATVIGTATATDHVNSQGFALGQIVAGDKPEFVLAAGDGIYLFEIPADPARGHWPKTRITTGTSSEGIGVGDIDGDGNLDITAASEKQDFFAWWKNPGDGSADWKMYTIGQTPHDGDRFAIVEINGDGRPDIVITEERYPGPDPDANLFWFEQPLDPTRPWYKHLLVTEYSLNNLGVADMDRDGDQDIVTCEHKGPPDRLELQIWENDGKGNFTKHRIDRGRESHLGTQLADLDGDGDLDIVSIAWDNYKNLHVWRNDAIQFQ